MLLWEKERCLPTARYYPAIIRFLGYDPFPTPTTLAARIKRQRFRLGLSVKAAAARVGVDEGTFGRWERGEWEPRMSGDKVQRFLGETSEGDAK